MYTLTSCQNYVVSDYYLYKKRAKDEVAALNKQGIEAYDATAQADEIFRKKTK